MAEELSADRDDDEVRRVAKEYLSEYSEHVHKPELKKRLEGKVEEWREKLHDVDEDDPLRDRIERQYEKSRERLDELEASSATERTERLLELVADDFVAEGVWLERDVIRAINLVLFNKYSDEVVVNREPIDETSDLDDEEVYEVSTEVRRMAGGRLEEIRG